MTVEVMITMAVEVMITMPVEVVITMSVEVMITMPVEVMIIMSVEVMITMPVKVIINCTVHDFERPWSNLLRTSVVISYWPECMARASLRAPGVRCCVHSHSSVVSAG